MEKRRAKNKEIKENKIINKLILGSVLSIGFVYFIILLRIVLFKYIGIGEILGGAFDEELRSLNLIPFIDFKYILQGDGIFGIVKNYIGNIGIFVPLGILIPMISPKMKWTKVVGIGFILSLFFEILQYTLCLGASDIDDLLMNTFGTYVGYIIYFIISKNSSNITKIRTKGAILLCLIGCLGIKIIYEIHPTSIKEIESIQVNTEILGDLEKEPSSSGKLLGMDTEKIHFGIYGDMTSEDSEFTTEKCSYIFTNSTKFYCKEIEAEYNKGGNVTKVTGIYKEIDAEKFKENINQSIDIWLNDDDTIKAVMIYEHTRADE